ncbi:Pumilio-like protein 11 [Raphanus sativus]|nr:Pumilio-like protein 11 [Raphanus sativus]
MEGFEFSPDDDLRGRTTWYSSSDIHHLLPPDVGFGIAGLRLTPISNPLQSRRNLNTARRADIDLVGLCQKSLSKMVISDEEEERSFFTGSHLPFLHGFDQHVRLGGGSFPEASSHHPHARLMQRRSSHHGDSRLLRLLAREDYPSNHIGGFTEDTKRDYFLRGGGSRQRREGSAKCMKEEALCPDLASMIGIYGSVYLMAKDQMGCRFLQKLIEEEEEEEAGSFLIIFRGLINDVVELGMDQFGNFLIQKLIKVCNQQQRTQILIKLTSTPGLLIEISLHSYGTRVVQKLIETVRTKTEINLVKLALKPGLLSLVRDVNGNHVIQSCLKFLAPEDNKFVLEGATRFCATIATHKYGCCVLQLCVKHSDGAERENLVAEIARNALHLAQDPFGNYVLQYIIEQNLGGVSVMFELKGNYVRLATQKFGSHVVEKCIRHYPESRSQIVHELISDPHFERLLQDPFANYVIQSALSKTKGNVRASLVDKVRRFGNLSSNPYCKRIFSKSRHFRK